MANDGILQQDDIRLRPFNAEIDLDTAIRWYKDREVLLYSEGGESQAFDADRVLKMYRYLSKIGELYIIEILKGKKWLPIGDATLSGSTMPIVIGDGTYRSKGIGKKVLSLLMRRAKDLRWKELNVKCIYEYNSRSLSLFLHAGFTISDKYTDPTEKRCISLRFSFSDSQSRNKPSKDQ